jgi:hypothetical protein
MLTHANLRLFICTKKVSPSCTLCHGGVMDDRKMERESQMECKKGWSENVQLKRFKNDGSCHSIHQIFTALTHADPRIFYIHTTNCFTQFLLPFTVRHQWREMLPEWRRLSFTKQNICPSGTVANCFTKSNW